MGLARILSGSGVAALLLGCTMPVALPEHRRPVRWVMVEKRFGDLFPEGRAGDAVTDPDSTLLALEPLDAEEASWQVRVDPEDVAVEVLAIIPSGRAAPGETVTATVRVARARRGEVYRLIARTSHADVHLLGPTKEIVREDAPASFRFTSTSIGCGGISIGVERVDENRR